MLKKVVASLRQKKQSQNPVWKSIFQVVMPVKHLISPDPAETFRKRPYMEQHLKTPLETLLIKMEDAICHETQYFGIPTLKSPLDFWIYLELLHEVQPDVLIEIGNYNGGSTLALAHFLDRLGKGRVIGIDIDHSRVPGIVWSHPRITLITQDACQAFDQVKKLLSENDRVFIIEDSHHGYANTLKILRTYHSLVTRKSYFIIEDGIIKHGLKYPDFPGSPYEAVETFIQENHDFEIDRSLERYVITWNPKGYLRKKDVIH